MDGTRPFLSHWSRLRIRRARAEALGCIVLGTQDAKVEILDYVTSPFRPTSLPTTISFYKVRCSTQRLVRAG